MYNRPNPGDVVTVATRYMSPLLDKEFDNTVYENVKVIKPFPWCSTLEFCIPAENEPYITVRTINLKNVILLEILGRDTTMSENGTNYVQVPGSKGNEYTVTIENGHGTGCECLGFQYRGRCRHLKEGSEIFAGLLTQG